MATDGWSKMTGHDVVDLARKFEDYGVEGDHLHRHRPRRHADRHQHRGDREARARDQAARDRLRRPVLASPTSRKLAQHEVDGIIGAIAGRAIYEGTLNFKEALKAAKGS